MPYFACALKRLIRAGRSGVRLSRSRKLSDTSCRTRRNLPWGDCSASAIAQAVTLPAFPQRSLRWCAALQGADVVAPVVDDLRFLCQLLGKKQCRDGAGGQL